MIKLLFYNTDIFLIVFSLMIFLISFNPFLRSISLLFICFRLLLIITSFGNWINYILCLIYLGGILVLFIYISSLIPNKKNFTFSFLFILFPFFTIVFTNYYSWNNDIFTQKLFFSYLFFKYLIVFLCFIILLLVIIRDYRKKIIYPLRLI